MKESRSAKSTYAEALSRRSVCLKGSMEEQSGAIPNMVKITNEYIEDEINYWNSARVCYICSRS